MDRRVQAGADPEVVRRQHHVVQFGQRRDPARRGQSADLGDLGLQPGERVLLHTHPVEESLTFLAGEGTATLGADVVVVGPGVTLYVPPGVVHGFACTSGQMQVLFVFSTHEFAETIIVEEHPLGREPV